MYNRRVTAEEHLAGASAAMEQHYQGDCVAHCSAVAKVLHAEGRRPWIGRVRQTIIEDGRSLHTALTPLRYLGRGAPTWTTHYVCGAGSQIFDPLAEAPLATDRFAESVFGRPITIETILDPDTTATAIARGQLENALRTFIQRELARGARPR
jgi:hypothetical protein